MAFVATLLSSLTILSNNKLYKMENTSEFLKQAVEFQDFAAKRGRELLMALGCYVTLYNSPDNFQFEDDGVTMVFSEKTSHDCPDTETVCLKIPELELSESEWVAYLELKRAETAEKEKAKHDRNERIKLAEKQRQYEKLKSELGY